MSSFFFAKSYRFQSSLLCKVALTIMAKKMDAALYNTSTNSISGTALQVSVSFSPHQQFGHLCPLFGYVLFIRFIDFCTHGPVMYATHLGLQSQERSIRKVKRRSDAFYWGGVAASFYYSKSDAEEVNPVIQLLNSLLLSVAVASKLCKMLIR